jgi:hypothetical protein
MFGSYGSFSHPANEITLSSVVAQRLRNQRGVVYLLRKRIQLAGVIVLNTSSLTTAQAQSALRSAINEREAAYSVDGQNFVFRHDDGSVSSHFLDSGTSLGGVRVVERNFPNGNQAEYASQRTFTVSLEADYAISDGDLMQFQETVEIVGTGGPRTVMIEVLNGPPQEQTINQQTKVMYTQRGSAIGFSGYPISDVPGPILPTGEKLDRRQRGLIAPTAQNGAFVNWGVTWSYFFETAIATNAFPNYK